MELNLNLQEIAIERKEAEMDQVVGQEITERDGKMAQEYVKCELCRNAEKQGGLPLWSLKLIERLCPYRPGSEKVYGRKAHEVRHSDAARVV